MSTFSPVHIGAYRIRRMVGRGASGTVYEAWDEQNERQVALKTIHVADRDDTEIADAVERFRRSAEAARPLRHPNIVAVLDVGSHGDTEFVVMEFIDGQPLKAMLDRKHVIPPALSVAIMRQVLEGLAYSHAHGVIHLDIKPANILLLPDGGVKITDFGIARIESSLMTTEGAMVGTPSYMAPEQFTGGVLDARTDIYAAGVLAFQMLTGRRPFEGSVTAIMHSVLNASAPPACAGHGVPAALSAAVAKAMARAPEQRFDSAADFAQALQAALAGNNAITAPVPGARNRAVTLATGSALVCLAAGTGIYLWLHGNTTSPRGMPRVTPPPVTPAISSATDTPGRVASIAASQPCGFLTIVPNSNGFLAAGEIGADAEPSARAAIAAAAAPTPITWQVTPVPSLWCDTLNLLRSAINSRPIKVSLTTGNRPLQDGELIQPDIDGPDFTHWLLVDDFARGGQARQGTRLVQVGPTAAHLYPSAQSPPRMHAAGEATHLRNEAWCVSAPYGSDLIIAVATSHPLFDRSQPEQEDLENFLPNLRAALGAAKQRGDHISAGVTVLQTAPGHGGKC